MSKKSARQNTPLFTSAVIEMYQSFECVEFPTPTTLPNTFENVENFVKFPSLTVVWQNNFEFSGTTLTRFLGSGNHFTIPDFVGIIGTVAFRDATTLQSVSIPDSVWRIEDRAFYNSGLTQVSFPQNDHLEVHNWAFARTRLTSVTIPANAHFYCGVFENIATLTSVYFEQGVARTAHRMFWGATNLTEVTLPDTLTYLNSYTFRYTALTSIVIPASVHTIGTGAIVLYSLLLCKG